MYLIPVPQKYNQQVGELRMPYEGQIVIEPSDGDMLYEYAKLCQQYVAEETGFTYELRRTRGVGPIYLAFDKNMKKETYHLNITETQIRIAGGSENGILYGIQTLRQLLRQGGAVLPCVTIDDYPAIKNRGYFYDVSRGRVPTLSWLKMLADTLCAYKMNQLQLYVEHSFLFSGMSEVWRDDTPLTATEIIELDDYCHKRGIELIPALASFGHLYKLLSTKSYCQLCELPDSEKRVFSFKDRMDHHTIDISNEASWTLITTLILEYLPLFRSKKFNICADETFDLGKGKNLERAQQQGTAEIYTDFLGKLCTFLTEHERIPMFWGDIMLGFPEMLERLPKETICLNWGYSRDETEEATRTYHEVGANQYVCPGVGGWNQLTNLLKSSFQNITKMCQYGIDFGALGMLNTDWGDYGHISHPPFSIPGLIYGAHASWNLTDLTYDELNQGISLLQYRDASKKLLAIVDELAEQDSFGWQAMVRFKEWYPNTAKRQKAVDLIVKQQEEVALAKAKNQVIDRCVGQLTSCIKDLDSQTKAAVKPYLIAATGMKIKNEIGYLLLSLLNGKQIKEPAWRTASDLETWYRQFRMLWYTVSKESELYRISEVIFWYADFLRMQ